MSGSQLHYGVNGMCGRQHSMTSCLTIQGQPACCNMNGYCGYGESYCFPEYGCQSNCVDPKDFYANLRQTSIALTSAVVDSTNISPTASFVGFCPLDDRRNQLETFMKRIVIIITTALVYGHFNSAIRGIQSPRSRIIMLFLFLTNPALPAIEALFLLLRIVWEALLCQKISSSLRFERSSESSRDLRVGRMVAAGFVAIQCIGTVAIMGRRFSRGAATGMDVKMFLYAVSALCVALQMLLALILGGFWVVGDQVLLWDLSLGILYVLLLVVGPTASNWLLIGSMAMVYLLWNIALMFPKRVRFSLLLVVGGILNTAFIGWLYWTDWECGFSTFLHQSLNGPWASWPVDKACPLLWKDPIADKLIAF